LYFVKNISAGEIITMDHIKSIRPGYGLPPKFLEEIIGMVAVKDATMGDAVKFDYVTNR
jgi:N-acetylneuraminate synthase